MPTTLIPRVFDDDDFQDLFKAIEKFVIACYSCVCPFEDLIKARYFLFNEKEKIGNIPPHKNLFASAYAKMCT